jgi:hypothetical protein
LHRLSTTRYLADSTLVNTKELERSIALFGGIQYDVIPDSTNTNKEETNEDFLLANNLKRESTRGAMSYLPGTKTEVEGVGQLFNSQKWTSSISTGTNATETAFKTISDSSSPSIIHIATHGFAFPDKAEKPKQRMGMMISTDREQQHYNAAEDPMLRCGLMFAGANLINHATGWLEGGLVTSYEKTIIDHDLCGKVARFFDGIDLSENAQAMSAIAETGPGQHFLGSDHTRQNFMAALFRPWTTDNNSFEQWDAEGRLDAPQRANLQWKRMLETYEPPPIDAGIDAALQDFIARRKASMPDAAH